MHFSKSMRKATAIACCCSLLSPTFSFAQETPPPNSPLAVATPLPPKAIDPLGSLEPAPEVPTRQTLDVEMSKNRVFSGVLVNNNGVAVVSAPVELWQDGQLMQASMTDEKGEYRLASLTGGSYQLNLGDHFQPVRCWSAGAAPPQAVTSLRSVVNEEIVRAQQRRGAVCGVINPWIIAGVAVAAIVIPVALHNNRTDRPASN